MTSLIPQIDALLALEEKAENATWVTGRKSKRMVQDKANNFVVAHTFSDDDSTFIAASRNAFRPILLALRSEVEFWEKNSNGGIPIMEIFARTRLSTISTFLNQIPK